MVLCRAKIGKSSVAGNGLFSIDDIEPGQAIFEIARPLITSLDAKQVHQTCGNCFFWTAYSKTGDRGVAWRDTNTTVRACSGCKSLYFCSKKCQAECWKRIHKFECKLLAKVQETGILPNASRAALHMLWMSPSYEKSPFKNLQSHLEDMQKLGGERWERMLALSSGLYRWSGTSMPYQYVQHCFATILTNSLTLYTPTYDQLGIIVDPFASSANHSCDPNAILVCDGPKLQFRSLRNIAKDEEIFISYVDVTNPIFVRKMELRERFHFHCHCSKCSKGASLKEDNFSKSASDLTEDWKHQVLERLSRFPNIAWKIKHAPDITHIASIAENHARTLLEETQTSESSSEMDSKAAFGKLNEGLQTLLGTSIWPEHRQPVPIIRHGLFVQLLSTKRYAEAFCQALRISKIYEVLYPEEWHPVRNIHAWTVAMLAIYLVQEHDSLNHEQSLSSVVEDATKLMYLPQIIKAMLDQIKECALKSHGEGSSFHVMAERKAQEALGENTNAKFQVGGQEVITQAQQTSIEQGQKLLDEIAQNGRANAIDGRTAL